MKTSTFLNTYLLCDFFSEAHYSLYWYGTLVTALFIFFPFSLATSDYGVSLTNVTWVSLLSLPWSLIIHKDWRSAVVS